MYKDYTRNKRCRQLEEHERRERVRLIYRLIFCSDMKPHRPGALSSHSTGPPLRVLTCASASFTASELQSYLSPKSFSFH